MDTSGLWVVIPAFEEANGIGEVVEGVRKQFRHVIVVDDGSSDSTGNRALEAGAVVLRHPVNLGQGAALQTGITFALQEGASLIGTFDADGQHNVGDLGRLVEELTARGVDVALGSRFLGSAPGIEWHRRILLRLAVLYTNLTTNLRLTDVHNGLRVFTRSAAAKIKITQNGMAHASEILEIVARFGLRYVEVPITVTYSDYSKRKGQRTGHALRVLTDLIVGRFHK